MMTIPELAKQLNDKSSGYQIGQLQHYRKEMLHMGRRPPGPIFSAQSIHDEWAFHCGGRTELQFNIGEDNGGIRHGVAFSLETSRTLPSIDDLLPKIARFNEYLRDHPSDFSNYWMWDWDERLGTRSEDRLPCPVAPASVKPGRFIFLGDTQPVDDLDVDRILKDFDRLLDLYFFTESPKPAPFSEVASGAKNIFQSGHTPYPALHTASIAERTLDVLLRHNHLQTQIYEALCSEVGPACVGTEHKSTSNGEIDFEIKTKEIRVFAELKTASKASRCIREALGQLLEYAYYGNSDPPAELWVIGTGECTDDDISYLNSLRSICKIPVFYRQFIENGCQLMAKI